MNKMKINCLCVLMCISISAITLADEIYVLGSGHSGITSARVQLGLLGHLVTIGEPLTDYSGYDQVWDLRYSIEITPADRNAMEDFLQVGGRIYLSGENGAFQARNNSINGFLVQIGAGTVSFIGNSQNTTTQIFTSDGAVVNSLHPSHDATYFFARTVSPPANSFLVTETDPGSGVGSLIGWDFGDISEHPNARLLLGYDIEIFESNGLDFTENVSFFLGNSLVVVPSEINVRRGTLVSGNYVELVESDDADLSIRRAVSDTQSRTEFEVKAVSPIASPSLLEVTLEGSVFARSEVEQTIELFDYVAGAWEQFDTRAATRFTDSTVTVAATGDLSRFVETGTMCLQARIRYQSINPRQRFASNTDQFIWTIGQ